MFDNTQCHRLWLSRGGGFIPSRCHSYNVYSARQKVIAKLFRIYLEKVRRFPQSKLLITARIMYVQYWF